MDDFNDFFNDENNNTTENGFEGSPVGFEPNDPVETGFSPLTDDSLFSEASQPEEELLNNSVPDQTEDEAPNPEEQFFSSFEPEKTVEESTATSFDQSRAETVATPPSNQAPQSEATSFSREQPANRANFTAPGDPQRPQPQQPYNFGKPYDNQTGSPYRPPQQPKKSKGGMIAVIVIVAVAILVALGFLGNRILKGPETGTNEETNSQTTISAESSEAGENAQTTAAPVQYTEATTAESALSAIEIADNCRSSVVGVMTYKNGQLEGEGSGVVMGFDTTNKYTYIMTCAHVISSSGVTYGVLTLDGMSYTAELVGYDSKTDIGVLKVEGTNFKVAQFGDSTKLKIGETVYAIGNPGGSEYFGSMTEGIVSAIDRNVSGTYNITCIQHDAAINPGNSGGALVNSSGQVIGINSSKIADTDYEGMGFAVPSSTATSIAQSLISYGYVPNRPKLGITYASVSNYQVYSMVVAIKGLPSGSLIITDIAEDSAFKGTDAQVGDMIIAVNGKKMDSSDVLLDLIDKGAVGDSLKLTLCRVDSRSYKTTTFDITINLVEDKGNSSESTTEEDSIYDFSNGGSGGGFGGDFGDFFKEYFGF